MMPQANYDQVIYDIGADGSEENDPPTLNISTTNSVLKKKLAKKSEIKKRNLLQVEINKRAYKNTAIIDLNVQ